MLQYLIAAFGVLTNISFLREFALLLLRLFEIRCYNISNDKDFTRKFMRHISKECISTTVRYYSDIEYPAGLCFSSNFVCWIHSDGNWLENWTVYLICKESYFKTIIDDKTPTALTVKPPTDMRDKSHDQTTPQQTEPQKVRTVLMLWRRGTFEDLRYGRTTIDVADVQPLGDQRKAINQILDVYQKKQFVKAFVHGAPGTGKSALGILLAKELNGFYCHSFDPTTPGDQLETLYATYKDYEKETPLIIVLEEANKLIEYVHHEKVEQHIKMPCAVKNKTTWCNLMDDMVFFRQVIFILTSNQPKEAIDTLDPAYLRPGRIDPHLEMKELIGGLAV